MDKNNPRVCAICNRRFANGKAMGGHMRSHLLKLKLALHSSSNPPPSSLTKRQLPTESDSPINPLGRRSKRLLKLGLNSPSSNTVASSLSDKDAAMCLLMLSRNHHQKNKKKTQTEEEYMDYDESLEEDGDEINGGGEDIDDEAKPKYYKCETCNKSFRSHQALGGHRASHNHKNKHIIEEDNDDDEEDEDSSDDHRIHQRRIFECPFCEKVFQSGQALGGHKKIHFAYLPVAHQDKASITPSSTLQSFDLNLPASTNADDEEEEVSLVENSRRSIYGQSV